MKYFAQVLDLKNDPELILEYENHHQNVWPEVLAAIRHVGILDMQIYRIDNHMFMHVMATDEYDPDQAAKYFANDPTSLKWESLMDKFQQRLPNTAADTKWVPMSCCFDLKTALANNINSHLD